MTDRKLKGSIILTPHSIDRVSQRFLGVWIRESSNTGDGLHTWLLKRAISAYRHGKRLELKKWGDGHFLYGYQGMNFIFKKTKDIFELMTITLLKKDHDSGIKQKNE